MGMCELYEVGGVCVESMGCGVCVECVVWLECVGCGVCEVCAEYGLCVGVGVEYVGGVECTECVVCVKCVECGGVCRVC